MVVSFDVRAAAQPTNSRVTLPTQMMRARESPLRLKNNVLVSQNKSKISHPSNTQWDNSNDFETLKV